MASDAPAPSVSATPILDSATFPAHSGRKKLRTKLKGIIVGVIVGALFGIVLIRTDEQSTGEAAADYMILFYFAAILLAVVIHEIGHLLAGWAVGFRFSSVSIGPVSLKRVYGKLKVETRKTLAGAAGLAGMHVAGVRRLHRRLLIFIAGGPAANLLSIPVTIVLVDYVFHASENVWVSIPAHLFIWISLIIGILNLVPFSVGALFTDGARIDMLVRSRVRGRRWMNIAAILDQTHEGVRPRQWKRTWVEAATSVQDRSVDDFRGSLLAYAAASDRKDTPSAARHLERCLELAESVASSSNDVLALEAAVFVSWCRKDVETAQKWLDHVKKVEAAPKLSRIRADIAIHCARAEFDAALTGWQEGLAFIEKLPVVPAQEGLKEGWLQWHAEILQRRSGEVAAPSPASSCPGDARQAPLSTTSAAVSPLP